MHNVLKYTVFFIVVTLLQVFLFDNLNLSVYVHPLIYVAFLVLLPMQAGPLTTLMLGLAMGLAIDFLSGNAGLHTIACLSTAFLRPYILVLSVGRENMREGGLPLPGKLGAGKFLKYVALMVVAHCLVLFFFESPTTQYFYLTLIRVLLSSAATMLLVLLTLVALRRY